MPQMATPGRKELLLKAGEESAPTFKSSLALRRGGAPPNGSWSSSPCSCWHPGGAASTPLVVKSWSVPLFRRVNPDLRVPKHGRVPDSEREAK